MPEQYDIFTKMHFYPHCEALIGYRTLNHFSGSRFTKQLLGKVYSEPAAPLCQDARESPLVVGKKNPSV